MSKFFLEPIRQWSPFALRQQTDDEIWALKGSWFDETNLFYLFLTQMSVAKETGKKNIPTSISCSSKTFKNIIDSITQGGVSSVYLFLYRFPPRKCWDKFKPIRKHFLLLFFSSVIFVADWSVGFSSGTCFRLVFRTRDEFAKISNFTGFVF